MGKLEQIKALKKGKGIQYLMDGAYKILHNPIAMFDTNYSLIAYTEAVSDDPLWNELISTGTFSMATQEFFVKEYFTIDVTNAEKLVVLQSDKLPHDRLIANVFNRDRIKVASIVMVKHNNHFAAEDFAAFNILSDKITAEVRPLEHYTAYGRAYHDTLIGRILDGDIKDTKIYAPHIQILYDGFKDYLYLAVAKVGPSDTTPERLAYIKDLLINRHRAFKFAIYAGHIIIIMSSKYHNYNIKQSLYKRDDFWERNDIFIGISSSFENLYELRRYYEEALAALKTGLESASGQRIFSYDN